MSCWDITTLVVTPQKQLFNLKFSTLKINTETSCLHITSLVVTSQKQLFHMSKLCLKWVFVCVSWNIVKPFSPRMSHLYWIRTDYFDESLLYSHFFLMLSCVIFLFYLYYPISLDQHLFCSDTDAIIREFRTFIPCFIDDRYIFLTIYYLQPYWLPITNILKYRGKQTFRNCTKNET